MDWLGRVREPLLARGERLRNRPFLDAAMAAAALVACADGSVSFAKRHALDEIVDRVDALRAFDVHGAVDMFDSLFAELREGSAQTRVSMHRAISAFAGDDQSADLLLRIACAIGRADGAVSASARIEIERIAAALGLSAPDLGGVVTKNGVVTKHGVVTTNGAVRGPSVIVLGNEKGGTGKSTTAMHLIVALLRRGLRVGSIDLDGRQGTLSRYIANREAYARRCGARVPMPSHRRIEEVEARDREEARAKEAARLTAAHEDLADNQVIVIDTPGSHSHLSRLGHARADVLITPVNDSFLDVDVLADVDRDRREVLAPSAYSRMICEHNDQRASGGRPVIDWIVLRNRMAHIDARNSRDMATLLEGLSRRMGFRIEPGFSERVVFREMFYRGLTLLDLPETRADGTAVASRRHARREVAELLGALRIAELQSAPNRVPARAV